MDPKDRVLAETDIFKQKNLLFSHREMLAREGGGEVVDVPYRQYPCDICGFRCLPERKRPIYEFSYFRAFFSISLTKVKEEVPRFVYDAINCHKKKKRKKKKRGIGENTLVAIVRAGRLFSQ